MSYTTETLYFDDPLFPNVPVTYVLTMCGSSRRASYMLQLQMYKPTKRVVILHNRGYRQSTKPKWVCSPAMDLWHANTEVFRREQKTRYVLILEDDFIFTHNVITHAKSICSFMESSNCTLYNLGCTPLLTNPFTRRHIRVYSGGSAHAMIWSNEAMRKFVSFRLPPGTLHDFEVILRTKTYMSSRPLAIQAHETTNNSNAWPFIARAYMFPWKVFSNVEHDGRTFYEIHHILARMGGIAPVLSFVVLCSIRTLLHCTKK